MVGGKIINAILNTKDLLNRSILRIEVYAGHD